MARIKINTMKSSLSSLSKMDKFDFDIKRSTCRGWWFNNLILKINKNSSHVCTKTLTTKAAFQEKYKSVEDMPGPKSLPIFGTSLLYSFLGPYSKDQMLTYAREDLLNKYGPIYKETLGGVNIVSLHHPKHIETVMKKQGRIPMRVVNEANIYWRKKRPDLYKTVGLVDSVGKEWYDLRKKVSPSVLKPEASWGFVEPLSHVADNFVNAIRDGKSELVHDVPDVRNYLFRFGLEGIWKMTLGFELGALRINQPEEAKKLVSLAMDLFESFAELSLSRPWWKMWNTPTFKKFCRSEESIFRLVNNYSQKVIKENVNTEEISFASSLEKPILERFLAKKDFDVRDVNTVVIDFIVAGIPTTAYFMSLLLHRLGQENKLQLRLQAELDAVIPNKNTTITSSHIESLPLLYATMQEGFRLTPIIPAIMRMLPEDIICDEYKIPAYTPILCQTRASAMSEIYFSLSDQFIPDRWIRTNENESFKNLHNEVKSSRFIVLPFGFGARMCVGRRLAEKEILVLLAKIFLNFNIETTGDMELANYFIIGPKKSVPIKFVERNSC